MFSKTPLRLILIVPFVAQITAAVGLTAWLSIRNGQRAVNEAVSQLWEETTALTNAEVNNLLLTTRVVNELSVKAIQRENLDLTTIRSVEELYWDYLTTFPGILGVGLGNASGDILGMFRRIDAGKTLYFLEYSSPETEGRYVSLQLNQQGEVIQSQITDRYIDARERPWYRAAVEAAGPIWTEVYTSVSQVEGHVLAINASQPIYTSNGQLLGVASVILDLGQVSQILDAIELSPSSQIYILEANGNLIGSSDGNSPVSASGNEVDRLLATDSKNQLIRESAVYLNSLFEGNFRSINQSLQLNFDLEGERQYLQITPIQSSNQLQWYVVVVAPESDFMAQINANTRNTIWLSLGALALAIGSSILTARWITRPLLQLNQAAKDITQGSLQSAPFSGGVVTGHSREVSELSHSFHQMTRQLQASFTALQASEANFRNMAANVPGAIFRYILRPDGTDAVLYMSPGCYQLWEIEAHAVEQDASLLWQMVDPDDLPAMKASVKASAQTLETWNWEWRITTPSGCRKWLQATGWPTRQPDGVVLWHTVMLDVSERKQAETQLQNLSNRLGLAIRSAHMGIWEWDVVSDRLIWDDRMYELYGFNPQDFSEVYAAWEAAVHPEDLPLLLKALEQALSGEKDFDTEFRVRRPDGTVCYIEAHAMVQRNAEGHPLRMIGVNWDITERKQAEDDLRNSLKDLADIEFSLDQSSILAITNTKGIITYVNDQFCKISQYSPDELIGQNHRIINSSYHSKDFFQTMWQTIATGQVWKGEIKNRAKDGSFYWVDTTIVPFINEAKKPYQYVAIRYDITERKQAETQLQDLTERLKLAVQAADMAIWEWTIASDRLRWDEKMFQLYNIDPDNFSNVYADWQSRVHPDDLPVIRAMEQKAWTGEQDYAMEFRIILPNGTIRHIASYALVQRDADGQPVRMVGTNLDISERKQAEERLIYTALHDALTDLPNRALLSNRLELAIKRAQQSSTYHFAVLFLDLDQFKVINDSLGHLVGDQLLMTVAQKLSRIIRPTDLVARLGGDEFVILLEHVPDILTVTQMAERILVELEGTTSIEGHSVFITTSIGIVWDTKGYTETSDLLRDADIALYRAKAKGRGRYEIFNVEMHVQAMKRMTLEHDLRAAIDQQEFITYYQPIVDLKSRRLIGFEALSRWPHPARGFISPVDFIPVAEETGLILPISRWILRSACEQVAAWQRQFPDWEDLRVSVNLSGQDLRQPTLVETVRQTLTQAGLPATSLTLEITESMLIDNIETTIDLLGQLRDLGIRISIDDFGTGYSSLSYLYNLPADYLKIDRSFVGNMQPGGKNYKIVQAVVSLSDQLQLAAIAEGIETVQQLEWLKDMGCELGQGYLLARPLTPDAAATVLSQGSSLSGAGASTPQKFLPS